MNSIIVFKKEQIDDFISIKKILEERFKTDVISIEIVEKNQKYENKFNPSYIIKTDTLFNTEITKKIREIILEIKPEIIAFPYGSDMKNLAARLSSELSLGILTDCNDIMMENGRICATKYAYGGSVVAKLYSKSEIKVITFNKMMNESSENEINTNKTLKEFEIEDDKKIRLLKYEKSDSFVLLEKAEKVIGIGRGVRREDIKLIEEFAKKINASIGYSRPLIHEGIKDSDYQIGITGKIISPKLYIAIGISGKEYHIKGVEKAKKIISINTNPNAPIKKYSDYFICEDYKKVISRLFE
jgi:electron transfer flavoprotein alpha subunit